MNAYAKQMARSVESLRGQCDAEIAHQWARAHFDGVDSRGRAVADHQGRSDPRCPICREIEEEANYGLLAELQEISEQQ